VTENSDPAQERPVGDAPPVEQRVADGPAREDRPIRSGSRRPTGRMMLGLIAVLVVAASSVAALVWRTGWSLNGSEPRSSSSDSPEVASAAASRDSTGILIVGRDYQLQSGSTDEAVRTAFSHALQLADETNPNDLGYPWIDPSTGELVVSAATARGRALLETTSFGVPARIRDVAHSTAELQKIQDDATRLNGQGVTDAVLIYETGPDFRDNRTWITIARFSRPLIDELARRFPPDAVIVVVDPTRYPLPLTTTP
jgi:hypothetical protein